MRNVARISVVAVAALGITAGVATAVSPSPRAESILLVRQAEPADRDASFAPEATAATTLTAEPTASPSVSPDDRGREAAEPGDDKGGATATAEPGDDKGGATATAEPGDDKGGHHGGDH